MPVLIYYGGAAALGGLGIKFVGDGIESLTDSTVKVAGAAMLAAALVIAYKAVK